ncbi:unnamed protein product [Dracunculus medinensis]|uniref:SH3 domain-containing protein n=1 Tax=Dracunculus medinensis TaxID=318479 RepID=A0A0N4U6Q8_DRAME|nr:unnamed protein product [Dracunculus medinensis]
MKSLDVLNTNVDQTVIDNGGMTLDKMVDGTHEQLFELFQPAAKMVADASTQLLHSFDDLNKSSEAYIKALQKLAESGRKCNVLSKQRIYEINEIVNMMKKLLEIQNDNTQKFSDYVTKVNQYSKEEKNKLKAIRGSYKEREKLTKKKLRKQNESNLKLQAFYDEELHEIASHQHQRYKFFVDKNKEWLNGYLSMLICLRQLLDISDYRNGIEHETKEKSIMINGEEMEKISHENGHQQNGELMTNGSIMKKETIGFKYTRQTPINSERAIQNSDKSLRNICELVSQKDSEPDELEPLDSDSKAKLATYTFMKTVSDINTPKCINNFRSSGIECEMNSVGTQTNAYFGGNAIYNGDKITNLNGTLPSSIPSDRNSTTAANAEIITNDFQNRTFQTRDCGKTVECVYGFQQQSSNQLSLLPGDLAVLIKCEQDGFQQNTSKCIQPNISYFYHLSDLMIKEVLIFVILVM